jgi:hypothetical protein
MTDQIDRPDTERTLASAESLAALEAVEETDEEPAAEAATPKRRRSRTAVSVAPSKPAAADRPETVSLVQGGADTIEAGIVTVQQGGANLIKADRVDIKQGGAGRVEAQEITVRQGGIGLARGERVSVELGGVGAALGTNVELHQGFSRFLAARESVRMEQSGAMTVIADKVEMAPQSGVVFLIARHVQGPVNTLFDWRAAVAFGAAFGVAAGLLRRAIGRR